MTAKPPLPTNLQDLLERVSRGEQFAFLFFWGHQVPRDGSITKGCLSQWYPAPFTVEGLVCPTAEHWMMAEKARLFGDLEMADQILAAPEPKQAKALGRRVRNAGDNLRSTTIVETAIS